MHSPIAVSPRYATLTKEEFHDLKVLDSCSVANAIERFQIQLRNEGFAEGGLTCRYPFMLPVLGYAMTLKVRSSTPPSKGRTFFESTEWWNALLAIPSPRILVLQDMDRHPGAGALIGDMHASVLKTLDCVAVVTNGAVRDVSRIEGLDFQMFSGAVSVSHAYSHIVHVGGPVQIGSLEISPGDLLHGDGNGIVRIPRDLAARIPSTAAALRKKDEIVIGYCHSPEFTVEGLRDLLAGQ
jgi:4-hydroxy-4-methyl-2-oxoglutarate aldolase